MFQHWAAAIIRPANIEMAERRSWGIGPIFQYEKLATYTHTHSSVKEKLFLN